MKSILLLSIFSLHALLLTAQTNYSSRIFDAITNEPVEGAVVQSKTKTTTAAKDGRFSIALEKDETVVLISAIGYAAKQVNTSNSENILLARAAFNLKEVVIAANTKNIYSTVSKIDLNQRPVNSAQEFLRYVPGLFIAQHQGGGKAEQIFLRGFDVDHGTDVKISVDGMPVNMPSHAHGQGYADLHFVIPELVKTIDYGKGSYYAEQGNFNTAGYVE